MHLTRIFLIKIFFFISICGYSQLKDIVGLPYIETYKDSLISNSFIRDICQGPNGFMYFTTNAGVVEYNGNNFILIKGSRDIKFDLITNYKNKAIFVTGDDEIGVIKPNKYNEFEFFSLKHLLDTSFVVKRTKAVISNNNSVLFLTQGGMLLYYPDSLPDTVFVKYKDKKIQNAFKFKDDFVLLSKDSIFKLTKKDIKYLGKNIGLTGFSAFEYNNVFYLVTYPFDIYKITLNEFEHFSCQLTESVKGAASLSAILTSKNEILIGTFTNGIYKADIDGNIIQTITSKHDLVDNLILKIFEDQGKNIWVATATGVNRMESNSAFQFFDKRTGNDLGPLYWSEKYNNELVINSSSGLSILGNEGIKTIKNGQKLMTSPFILNNNFFCSSESETYQLKNNELVKVFDSDIKQLIGNINENLMLYEDENKIFGVSQKNNVLNRFEVKIEKDKNEEFLGVIDNKFIIGANIQENVITKYEYIECEKILKKLTQISFSERLPKSEYIYDLKYNKIIISDSCSIYSYNTENDSLQKLEVDPNLLIKFKNNFKFNIDSLGNWIIYNQKYLLGLKKSENKYVKDNSFYKIQESFLDHIALISNDQIIISSKNGFITFNPNVQNIDSVKYRINFR